MSDADELLGLVQEDFGLFSPDQRRGQWNEYYAEFPARLSVNSISADRYSPKYTRLPSACAFLSGLDPPPGGFSFTQARRPEGSISVVVGEYGLGKTELMHHVAERLLQNRTTGRDCLPVKLGSCAAQLRVLVDPCEPKPFLAALLAHIPDVAPLAEPLLAELVTRLCAGKVVLVLDALDELVQDQSQHAGFLENVARLLAPAEGKSRASAVVSVRLENLRHVDGEGRLTARALTSASRTPVNFLVLEFFDDSTVNDYLLRRIGSARGDVIKQLMPHRRLRDVLRRPLMARILCDVLTDPRRGRETFAELIERIKAIDSAAQLLDLFTENVGHDSTLLSDQASLQKAVDGAARLYRWDNDRLARESLDAYRHGAHALDKDSIARVLGAPPDDGARHLARMAHKCPFLALTTSRQGVLCAHFTHRVFYEYFVTKGIVDELPRVGAAPLANAARDADADSGGADRFASFHDLVLNIDMHRFLRSLTISAFSEDRWYAETRVAYGLSPDSAAEWSPPLSAAEIEGLDDIRKALLDARSGVSDGNDGHARLVDEYLGLEEDGTIPARGLVRRHLTPRYQVPNYEAVAVCLTEPDVYSEARMERFSKLLHRRMLEATRLLNDAEADTRLREPLELLVERILDIGRRLDWTWVCRWSAADVAAAPDAGRPDALVIRSGKGCRDRVIGILVEIAKAKRPGAAVEA